MDFSTLSQCMELRDRHIAAAAESSESMRALLDRFEQIAEPGKGAPIILAALARMGTTACDWIEGELRVEVWGDARRTTIGVSQAIGGGFREKVFGDAVLNVPFEEFQRSVHTTPKIIEPLSIAETPRKMVLTATVEVRRTSMPPPMISIDPNSFVAPVPSAAVPSVPSADEPFSAPPLASPKDR